MSVSVGYDFLVARDDILQTMKRVSDFMFHHPESPKCDLTLSEGVFSDFPAINDFLKPPYELKDVGDSVGLDGMVET